ncbi:glycerate kinase type-2 family protein, partial [Brucella pituitosa]
QMAAAFERAWAERHEGEDAPLEGIVVTRYGYGAPCKTIEIIEASHPVPDDAGLAASKRLFDAVSNLTQDDLVVALVSGGGSALLPSPPEGLTLDDEIAVNKALLASGAPISAMNAVRKHLSTIKGGRLAAHAHPAKVFSLVVSDIPGDNPAFVASGPTVPDKTSRDEALKIIDRYKLELPEAVLAHIKSEKAHAPKPDDTIFADNEVRVIASAAVSLEAAVKEAERHG